MAFKYFKIVWNSNTITVSRQLDNATAFSKMRDGFETVTITSGEKGTWSYGQDYFLRGTVHRIPLGTNTTTDNTGRTISTWDGATGWESFLEYAAAGNTFQFYPDDTLGTNYTCTLESPLVDGSEPQIENNGLRKIDLLIRTTSGPFLGY